MAHPSTIKLDYLACVFWFLSLSPFSFHISSSLNQISETLSSLYFNQKLVKFHSPWWYLRNLINLFWSRADGAVWSQKMFPPKHLLLRRLIWTNLSKYALLLKFSSEVRTFFSGTSIIMSSTSDVDTPYSKSGFVRQ